MGIILRRLGAFVLLDATPTPTRWNDVTRACRTTPNQMPTIAPFSLTNAFAATFGARLWALTDRGLLGLYNFALTGWLCILTLRLIPGDGMSPSIPHQRISGQTSMDLAHA
jgi:hypothetical protein